MGLAGKLLGAPHVGVRELKSCLSKRLKEGNPLIITDRGKPVDVILPYQDAMELVEMMDEIADCGARNAVQEGRASIKSGAKGVPVSRLFQSIRDKRG